jgi:environmental stress-induced protein Ves
MPEIKLAHDFKVMPWKNGGGLTRELYRIPHQDRPEDFTFRLSEASVNSSGDFSLFPGIERTLLLLKGSGFNLTFKEAENINMVQPLKPICFRGEDQIHCELIDGPCLDFNVMIERQWGEAKVSVQLAPKNSEIKFRALAETYLYVFCQHPKLIILKPQEVYQEVAEESLAIIMTEVTRRDDSTGHIAKA